MSHDPLLARLRYAVPAVALFGATLGLSHAAAPESPDVIAESSRARITLADYEAEVSRLPPNVRGEFAASELRLKQYLDNLYVSRVLAADARAAGLDKDPAVQREIAGQIEKTLAKARVDRIDAATAEEFDKSRDKYIARARELYTVNRAVYATREQVRAAHILVAVKNGDRVAAQKRADELHAKAVAGADFNALAREFSDDPTASRNGGELGFFEAKTMDPAFSAAAFAMTRKGEISAPVLSKFGYHIILFEDRKPAGFRSFESVQPEILADLKKKALADARAEMTRQIFADPTLKVNAELIDRIHSESAQKSDTSNLPAQK
jgi:peptidyl-prolyl cis-trans isomerase C